MKIVEVINSLSLRGGAEVFLYSLVKELAKDKNNKILVISLFDRIDESFKDIETDNVVLKTCGKKRGVDFKASKVLKQLINDFEPDVVHTHLSCSPSLYLAFGAKKRKWKYIHTVHNLADKESSGVVYLINKRLIKKNIMKPVGISNLITSSIEERYKIKGIKTIFNGSTFFKNEDLSFEKREYDFICVARFYEQKNHLFLLKTFKTFLSAHPDSRLALVGDGLLKGQCEMYCNENNMTNSVVFIGPTNDVGSYLNKSKALVLASIFEGNPICILEGMSIGLPVVSSRVGGVPDVVVDGRNGYLFESNNGEQFISCLNQVLEKNNWERIKKNNLEDIQKYSIKKCSEEYCAYFRKG